MHKVQYNHESTCIPSLDLAFSLDYIDRITECNSFLQDFVCCGKIIPF